MATHFSILAWRMPWTEEPNGLQSMGLQSQTRLSNFHLLTHTDNLASYLQLQVPGLFKKSFGGCFKNVDFFFLVGNIKDRGADIPVNRILQRNLSFA